VLLQEGTVPLLPYLVRGLSLVICSVAALGGRRVSA